MDSAPTVLVETKMRFFFWISCKVQAHHPCAQGSSTPPHCLSPFPRPLCPSTPPLGHRGVTSCPAPCPLSSQGQPLPVGLAVPGLDLRALSQPQRFCDRGDSKGDKLQGGWSSEQGNYPCLWEGRWNEKVF